MTVIINTIWGGRVCQIVDRHISRSPKNGPVQVIDKLSTKACVFLCKNALASIAYTGISVAHNHWMDTVIASCLARDRKLSDAMIQLGSSLLSRPVHTIIKELSFNLNGQLNSDSSAREHDLHLSIVGWQIYNHHKHPRPFSWEMSRDTKDRDGRRYFAIKQNKLIFREYPHALWGETLGSPGNTINNRLLELEAKKDFTHDDVEKYFKEAISIRATETPTVGSGCLAIQLNPLNADWQVQFTNYPDAYSQEPPRFISAWVLTPRMICAPGWKSASSYDFSECGKYLMDGFKDHQTKLKVRTRLPIDDAHFGGPSKISYGTQQRKDASNIII